MTAIQKARLAMRLGNAPYIRKNGGRPPEPAQCLKCLFEGTLFWGVCAFATFLARHMPGMKWGTVTDGRVVRRVL